MKDKSSIKMIPEDTYGTCPKEKAEHYLINRGLSTPTANILVAAGIFTFTQLGKMSPKKILKVPNIGPVRLKEIIKVIDKPHLIRDDNMLKVQSDIVFGGSMDVTLSEAITGKTYTLEVNLSKQGKITFTGVPGEVLQNGFSFTVKQEDKK